MEQYDACFSGSIADVRRARATSKEITVEVRDRRVDPNGVHTGEGWMFPPGSPYHGPILAMAEPGEFATVTVSFGHAKYAGAPERNPEGFKQFPVYVAEERRLHFLVFDPNRQSWYLSCGGNDYCWWCKGDDAFWDEMDELNRQIEQSYTPPWYDDHDDWI